MHASEDEDAELRNALYRSALESSKFGPLGHLCMEPLPQELESVVLYRSVELARLWGHDTDTLVFIGAPPKQPDQAAEAYGRIAAHFVRAHRIHSKNVLNLGSEKLGGLLAPTSQFRTERRLKNQRLLLGGRPSGIKYLLDLRPPIEGEEALVLVTELSCSSGVLSWFKAQQKYGIPRTMVCGQDDIALLPLPKPSTRVNYRDQHPEPRKKKLHTTQQPHGDPSLTEPQEDDAPSQDKEPKRSRIGNWEGIFPTAPPILDEAVNNQAESDPTANANTDREPSGPGTDSGINATSEEQAQVQPEYSQLRHWSSIERLLHAIEGNDPMLDSAPKLWNFVSMAKFFGCASNERISGWVTKWLFTAPNHNFIQCNPEICYRIGLDIQSEALLKDAFSILVGEKALINVHHEHSAVRSLNIQSSVAGRRLELLDDDDVNRIDHAANIFIKRIQSTYEALIGQDMHWLEQSTVFSILANFVAHSNREKQIAQQLKEQIKTFVRARVLWVLARNYEGDMPEMEQAPESVRPFYPHASAQFSRYTELGEEERIFSRFFWLALRKEDFEVGDNAVFTLPLIRNGSSLQGVPCPGWSSLARNLQGGSTKNKLIPIERDKLCASAASFMKILNERYWKGRSKQKDHGSFLNKILHPQRQNANSIPTEAQPRTPFCQALPDEEIEFDNRASTSAMQHFEDLHLSSPKRARATDPMRHPTEEKRTRLDVYGMLGRSDQTNNKQTDLPIRVAVPQGMSNAMPVEGPRLMKVAQWQAVESPEAHEPRFAYVETEVSINDSSPASDEKTDAWQPLFEEPAHVRTLKEKGPERPNGPDYYDEHSFPIEKLLNEVTQAVSRICDEVLLAPHFFQDDEIPPTDLIDSLMSLTDDEWKYLPLWAGGCDDGSGGVFNDLEPPILEAGGFDGGTRGLGCSRESSAIGSSSSWSEIISTVGKASKEAVDGTATETATVRSLDDVDMDVRSLDDESSTRQRETETMESMGFSSAYDLDANDNIENPDSNNDDVDLEEPEWYDCDM
ncbi:hypothetical protein EPUS_08808 [Endocarpon pusillum Z07020]|uniref:Uncharacterized protein n=1 Tax=Endocarpon pusillum (strain Z07020 / HMAS-L-300199) TaxID=1263415 RepID=U1HXW1_ENDPU|nr:uncharacterized protein EPUS_08808 [Endocarpon pusillum Z07020]ERF75655.1 hypothetical protein EPUS_08808 [Endocarpon pusillum Z07020]